MGEPRLSIGAATEGKKDGMRGPLRNLNFVGHWTLRKDGSAMAVGLISLRSAGRGRVEM
jgi:hypothetical protein